MPDLKQQFDADANLTLGALGGNDVIAQNSSIDGSRAQGFRIMKSEIFMTLTGKTTAEGPIIWGVACNMDAAEIEAAMEADPQDRNADDSRGEGTFIKILDVIGLVEVTRPTTNSLNSPLFKVSYGRNGWSIPEGQNLSFWAMNVGAALTSGTVLLFSAEHFGVWLRD